MPRIIIIFLLKNMIFDRFLLQIDLGSSHFFFSFMERKKIELTKNTSVYVWLLSLFMGVLSVKKG